MARDYKGFGNQPMNAVMEITDGGVIQQANGIDIGKSEAFFRGELKDISRTLRTDDTSGVVEWKN